MIKVIIIFVVVVCIIMVLGCDNKSKSTVTEEKTITGGGNEIDIPDYSKKHARSIQDDIKKVVSKNI